MTPHYWNDATRHLSRQCPTMKQLISRYKGEGLVARTDGFYSLLRAIVGQQISVKAADSVWVKVEEAVKPLTPQKLLATTDEALRACGLSGQKVAYARNVAEFFIKNVIHPHPPASAGSHGVHPHPPTSAGPSLSLTEGEGTSVARGEGDYWSARSDEEIIAELTSIKGIGSWTAEMFLMFHLARPDVLPLKDLGLLKAMNLYYVEESKLLGKKWLKSHEYEAIAAPWAPYRSVATWYLWRALDPVPVAY